MTIATKNGVPIVKGGVIASNCGCCDGWFCYPCETITPSQYSTPGDFSDPCWGAPQPNNPLVIGVGSAMRCAYLPPVDRDVLITLSAAVSLLNSKDGVFGVGIGDSPLSLSPFSSVGFRAFGAFSIVGQSSVRWAGWPGNVINQENFSYSGTITVLFRRLSGQWFVEHGSLPQTKINLPHTSAGEIWHGISGTNGTKTYSHYSFSLVEL